ncbi:MAG: D-alanyl-D-alanine carboxypeptidase/D-alanyl-D-alanine-endopeptidase [Bacteroidetes bacterium]|nr:D-alanyl-D-alanine carboxypeptidase/D-alanyl-D-alanine-endopeptidase [Bacteroidota bacterium]
MLARIYTALLGLLLVGLGAQAQSLRARIERLLDQPAFANAFWGVEIRSLQSGRIWYARNARKSFVPASNLKLLTTAAALDQLGAEWRFETSLYADGPIADGLLRGDLVVRGGGDPTIGARFFGDNPLAVFEAWADSLLRGGVRVITGDIIGDDDAFDDLPLGYGWSWDDEVYGYSAQISALSFNENVIEVRLLAGAEPGSPARLVVRPETDYVRLYNQTLTLPADSALRERYDRERAGNTFYVRTRLPVGQEVRARLSVDNPTLYFTTVLYETLQRRGIQVLGRPRDVDELSIKPDYGRMRLLWTHRSPPLREIVRVINKISQNLYAELLLRALGRARFGVGSAEAGIRAARESLVRAGLDTSRVVMVDGSGLSRLNLITPQDLVKVLLFMRGHPHGDAFFESLPIAGVDGTLANRMRRGPARGRVRAKTGFVGHVRTLSGYLQTQRGEWLVFSLMANHYTVPTAAVNEAQDRLLELLVQDR